VDQQWQVMNLQGASQVCLSMGNLDFKSKKKLDTLKTKYKY